MTLLQSSSSDLLSRESDSPDVSTGWIVVESRTPPTDAPIDSMMNGLETGALSCKSSSGVQKSGQSVPSHRNQCDINCWESDCRWKLEDRKKCYLLFDLLRMFPRNPWVLLLRRSIQPSVDRILGDRYRDGAQQLQRKPIFLKTLYLPSAHDFEEHTPMTKNSPARTLWGINPKGGGEADSL